MEHRARDEEGTRAAGGRAGRDRLCAALDLGTNNCRLMMARATGSGFKVVDAFSRIVRLGEGLAATGRLSDDAMERTIDALRQCAGRMARRNISRARTVATEACRRATNGAEFLSRVEAETGLALEVISPEEEAGLALAGCAPLLKPEKPAAVVFDIGGGSTEILWIETGRDGTPRLRDSVSLPHGVVTLSDRFGGAAICPDTYQKIRREIFDALSDFDARHRIGRRVADGEVDLLGTSGTVTTVAGVHLCLGRYDRRRVDGATIDFETVHEVAEMLGRMSNDDRGSHPCIGEARADLVVPGCAVLAGICDRVPVGSLTVADRGVRDGILLGLFAGRRARPRLS